MEFSTISLSLIGQNSIRSAIFTITHFLLGIKVFFWVIVLNVIILDIKIWIAECMVEMFNKYTLMFPPTILNVTNAKTMDT
jgi:hypothetical protein